MARRSLPCILTLIAASALLCSAALGGPLDEGRSQFQKGDYQAAIGSFSEAAKRDETGAAHEALFDAYVRVGAYDDAAKAAKALSRIKARQGRAAVLAAELDLLGGRYEEVIGALEPVVARDGRDLRARWVLGQANLALGRTKTAFEALDPMADVYLDGKVTGADELTWLALGLWHTRHFKNANQIFGEALQADPKYLPANVHWGFLFLAKYNYRDADRSFSEVLEADPNHPTALVGMALVDIGSDNDLIKATERIDKALEVNPKLVDALLVRAQLHVLNEEYEKALAVVEQALALNPRRLEALSAAATVRFLRDEPAKFDEAVAKVLAVNAGYGDVYADAAEAGERVHRYEEAIRLYEKALAQDPENGRALVGLGIGYSRTGDDERAHEYLDKGFEADPYNVRAYNLASIFYDSMIKQFEMIERDGMRFRFEKREKPVLSAQIIPEILEAKSYYDKRYEFEPKGPLQIEVFPDPSLFAIRTVGLPRMGAHGVCFGKVITSRSPSDGNFNWKQVLWHEMAHVYHIQMSGSRVPRWFTEGLAVHETRVLREAWARPMDLDLYERFKRGELVGISDFNSAFTQAKSLDDILVAYYQASVVVQYIDERWGLSALRSMLTLWGQKKSTPAVFQEALGVAPAAFDGAFRAWLGKRLSRYDGLFEPDVSAYEDSERWEKAARENPEDAKAQAELAMAALAGGDLEEAKKAVERALQLDEDEPLANYLKGQQVLHEKGWEKAREHLEKLLDKGLDGISIREGLAVAAQRQGDLEAAEKHWLAVTQFEPSHEGAWRALYELREDRADGDGALEAALRAAEASQMDAALELAIVEMARERGKDDLVRVHAMRGLEIAPFAPAVHLEVARLELSDGKSAAAQKRLEQALTLEPEKPAPLKALLAKALLAEGKKDAARGMAREALAADPDSAVAREVMDELD